jgi:diguanylate cyclase (GGDEF)-like protein
MIRILMIEDDQAETEIALAALRSSGVACQGERVATEEAFRTALDRSPDLILSDISLGEFDGFKALSIVRMTLPTVPFIFRSPTALDQTSREILARVAGECIPKWDREALVITVLAALPHVVPTAQRAVDLTTETVRSAATIDTAGHLFERQASLERMLQQEDGSLSGLFRRMPPWPGALVMIQELAIRERYLKILHHAGIVSEVAPDTRQATVQLKARVPAVLFTDAIGLVREVRQLRDGPATHVVFVCASHAGAMSEALQAGANGMTPKEAQGELFWPQLSTVRRIVSFASSLQTAVSHNRILATLDELTHCGNRHYFERQFPREIARATRLNHPMALLMCDVDEFKTVNDRYGHQVGDEVLRELGDRLTHSLRLGEDWVARTGGEEFAIVLSETGAFKALAVAERLRGRLDGNPFETSAGSLPVTASFGVCAVRSPSLPIRDLRERMIAAADAALYRSKREGRNRVSVAAEMLA